MTGARAKGTTRPPMLIEIPPGTTLESLVTDAVPAAHQKLVPASAGSDRFGVGLHFFGGPKYTLEIAGATLTVREGADADVDLWLGADATVARAFVADLSGDKRFAPTFTPPGDVAMISDPRVFRRIKMVTGKLELALVDFPGDGGPRASLWVCLGAPAKKPAFPEDADVTIETHTATFERMLRGALGPEDALADGDVKVSGKRLVAMQLALALAPLYPKR